MGEIEGTYRVLQTPGARLGTQRTTGISTLEPGQTLSTALSSPTKAKNLDLCSSVLLLDGTVLPVEVGPKTTGQALLSQVFTHLNVVETDYFGIEFQTAQSQWVWLEPLKFVNKQLRKPKNAKMRLAVKFFPPDPGQLQEEYTRYLFAMQIKRDLAEERLVCSDNTTALLVSLLLQSEVGDYDQNVDQEHLKNTEYLQRQYCLEERILECHRQHLGMSPADADFQILEISRRLELYGIRFHLASDREGAKINLSVSHMGVLVFQGNTKINTFNWSKIRKLSFKRRRFLIKLHPEVHGPYQDSLEFLLPSRDMCKRFWKICVEYHSFFRLQDQPKPKSKPVLLSRGSSFRYSGRTQKQLIEYVRDTSIKRPPCERRHSKPRVSPSTVIPNSPKQIIPFTESVRTSVLPSSLILSSFFNPPASPKQKDTTRNEHISASQWQEEPGRRAQENAGSSVHSPLQGVSPNPTPSLQNKQDPGKILDNEHVQQGENVRLWVSGVSDSLLLTEEFIDDDPADISFSGGAELYSYGESLESPDHDDIPPEEYFLDGVDVTDFNGNTRSTDANELLEMKAQASRMQSFLIPSENGSLLHYRSETGSLVHRRSESSSLTNLNGIPSFSRSANHSTASSMINFPACSVRSESSSAFQFGDIADQLEQLSYPPTTTEDSSSSEDDSWDSEDETPIDMNLFFSNPLTHYTNFNQLGLLDKKDAPDPGNSPLMSPTLSDSGSARADDVEETSDKMDEAFYITKEILSTETSHLKDIEVITLWLEKALSKGGDQQETLEHQMKPLFSCMDPIRLFHQEFLQQLEDILSLWEGRSARTKDMQILGDFMLRNMTALRALLPSLHKLEEVFLEMQRRCPGKQEMDTLLQEFEQQRVCYLPFSCLLLKSLQRPLQYEKLLERLCRHYPPSHHDYNNCQRALGEASAVSSRLRHRLLHLQNLQRLDQLERDLLGGEHLSSPGREFIREGCLYKLTKSGLQQRMFYLFSDMLLYTRKGLSCTNQFRVHGRLPLHGMLAEDSHSSVPHCFTIYSAQTTIGVAASSQVDMRRWLDDLNAAISRAPRYSELSALSLQQPVLQAPGQIHHPNTLSHVCWYRNQSVSLTDHITMMENQLSGYLLRKFKNSNGWQRLWVIFTNFCLYFYKTHQEDAPLASLPLLGYTVSVPTFSDPVTCCHVFKLHFKSHVYFFRADSEYTWRRWMEVIRRGVSSPGKIGHLAEDGIIVD
ncbi:FERM, ARHGEF and pleckstrin domain-containing protein 2 [Bufo bufo]|uniref:FERM, ARHGEF and pleckstrin domain-containing protein 2 n=1 Tax=Bufo bufo TaxID=8384 RepID=UPI001ABE6D07|nr:FERM, ARHGEF and pleckstrin domain-containing protein 2 [Bufo bufo]